MDGDPAPHLTLGKVYEIVLERPDRFVVQDDSGNEREFYKERFEIIKEESLFEVFRKYYEFINHHNLQIHNLDDQSGEISFHSQGDTKSNIVFTPISDAIQKMNEKMNPEPKNCIIFRKDTNIIIPSHAMTKNEADEYIKLCKYPETYEIKELK
jgi:N-dimethylarginine dimethylaminohydrolase